MVQLNKDLIMEMLKDVFDPELGVNIVDLGLVYDALIDEQNNVEVVMTLTSMGCPLGPVIIGDIQRAVGAIDGAGEVGVRIVWSPPWSPDMMSEDAKDELGIW